LLNHSASKWPSRSRHSICRLVQGLTYLHWNHIVARESMSWIPALRAALDSQSTVTTKTTERTSSSTPTKTPMDHLSPPPSPPLNPPKTPQSTSLA
jgi:hypothetical protein